MKRDETDTSDTGIYSALLRTKSIYLYYIYVYGQSTDLKRCQRPQKRFAVFFDKNKIRLSIEQKIEQIDKKIQLFSRYFFKIILNQFKINGGKKRSNRR